MTYNSKYTFVHTADIHLGMEPEDILFPRCDRGREIKETFFGLLDLCHQEKIDFLLISGDLFHKSPSYKLLKEVDQRFASLLHTKVIVISGNHDPLKLSSTLGRHHWPHNVFWIGGEEGQRISFGDIHFYGISYTKVQYEYNLYKDIRPSLEKGTHILLAHGGDSLHCPFTLKEIANKGFDYVALGHIHQPLIQGKIAYPGSLVPLHRNEKGSRGYILGRVDLSGTVQIKWQAIDQRVYKEIILKVKASDDYFSLKKKVEKSLYQEGINNMFVIYLKGQVSESIQNKISLLYKLGLIIDIQVLNKRIQKNYRDHRIIENIDLQLMESSIEDSKKKSILKRIKEAIHLR